MLSNHWRNIANKSVVLFKQTIVDTNHSNSLKKGGEILKMKILTIIALAAALGLGACAHKDNGGGGSSSMSSSHHSSYSK